MTDDSTDDGTITAAVPFISRVRIKNYKSIAECDVRLGPFTVLVGPNGSGKSNFLDALAFLSRAVERTPGEAIESREGLGQILRRVPDQAASFSIAIEATIPAEGLSLPEIQLSYEFEIGSSAEYGNRDFEVIREECETRSNGQLWRFRLSHGTGEMEAPGWLRAFVTEPDRLYLLAASTQAPFARVFAGLRAMQFFNFVPEFIRPPHRPALGTTLSPQGENLGSVLSALATDYPWYKERIDAYLQVIVPGVISVDPEYIGQYVSLAMRANTGTDGSTAEFGPNSMSDGTVRAAAVLAALFQPATLNGQVRLIGIEEPELALHPAAAGALFDALTEASEHVQVIATSQSAELLDRKDVNVSMIRPVTMQGGITLLGEVDSISREIAEEKLFTIGELMRRNQLSPETPEHGRPGA